VSKTGRTAFACESCPRRKVRCLHDISSYECQDNGPPSKRRGRPPQWNDEQQSRSSKEFRKDILHFLSKAEKSYLLMVIDLLRDEKIGYDQLRVLVEPAVCLSPEEFVGGLA
jgi:transcriptional antiterminator